MRRILIWINGLLLTCSGFLAGIQNWMVMPKGMNHFSDYHLYLFSFFPMAVGTSVLLFKRVK